VAKLEARHDALWREQAGRLLTAEDDIVDMHPRIFRLATTLAAGTLAGAAEMAVLDEPPVDSRAEAQRRVLADYQSRQADAVNERWSRLGRRERRRSTRDQLKVSYDDQQLLVCDTCALAYPRQPRARPSATVAATAAAPS
jgi:hypothetical protein